MGNCKPIICEKWILWQHRCWRSCSLSYLAGCVFRLVEFGIYLPSKGVKSKPFVHLLEHIFSNSKGVFSRRFSWQVIQIPKSSRIAPYYQSFSNVISHLDCSPPDVSIGSLWESLVQKFLPSSNSTCLNEHLVENAAGYASIPNGVAHLQSINAISSESELVFCFSQVPTLATKQRGCI